MHDALGHSMGDIFAGPGGIPYLWCHPWSPEEAARLVSSTNPNGNLSINDLELAGHIAQLWLALPRMTPLSAILSGSSNSMLIWWIWKGSSNTPLPLACCSASAPDCSWLLHQHQVTAPTMFLAGKNNHLANAASSCWDLSDSQLCSFFYREFPQATSWTMLHLTMAQQHGLSTTFAKMRLLLASIPVAP
jgi:hypothetical protein